MAPLLQNGSPESKPRVLLIALDNLDWFDDMYADLIEALAAKSRLQRVTKATSAMHNLKEDPPHTAIIIDAGIANHNDVLISLNEYVQQGGTAVFTAMFGNMIAANDMQKVWKSFGMSWERGNYHRTEVEPRSLQELSLPQTLPAAFSQKTVFLKNVNIDAALWTYQPCEGAKTQSLVFSPKPTDGEQCASLLYPVGRGKVGYVGDVNGEYGSTAVVAVMCGFH